MATTASTPRCDRHRSHVGACPACQRVQLARWREQLVQAEAARHEPGRTVSIGGISLRARTAVL